MESKIVYHQSCVKIEFAHKYKRLRHNTGVRVDKKYFDREKLVSRAIENYEVLNNNIRKLKKFVDEKISEDIDTNGSCDVDRVKILLEKTAEESTPKLKPLPDYFKEFVKTKTSITPGSKKTYNILGNTIDDFQIANKRKYYVDDIDKKWIDNFGKYILSRVSVNTAHRRFTCFRSFWTWLVEQNLAKENKYLKEYRFATFKPDFVTLSEYQIHKLRDATLTGHHKNVRDIFLVLLYTGMRYSDYHSLEAEHVHDGMIDKIAIKTKIRFKVPIHPDIADTIKERPKMEGQVFNRGVKELCDKLEFNNHTRIRVDINEYKTGPLHKMVSSHVGRHTFATRCLEKNIPHNVIMGFCGWTNPEMLFHYAEKINRDTKQFIAML